MSLRLKLILALVTVSAAVAAIVGVFSYQTTATQLNNQVDESLRSTTEQLASQPALNEEFRRPRQQPITRSLRNFRSSGDIAVQIITPNGTAFSPSDASLPVEDEDRSLARSQMQIRSIRDVELNGDRYRLMTASLGNGRGAVQAARSLSETEAVLSALRTRILAAALIVLASAAAIGWVIARQMTERLQRLTAAAEGVASTRDPAVQVPVSGSDETARLGTAFNGMLQALSQARDEQQRLVQNAGHELRTPLTSLRTNVFALTYSDSVPDEQRERILADLRSETEELTGLINEVVDLATDRRNDEPPEPLRLGELIERAVERARKRTTKQIIATTDQSLVMASGSMILRAVRNLIENAAKFDQSGAPIEVACVNGRVEVADRGPGLGDGEENLVFERFYRSEYSRSLPGSGLGLAIVADVVSQHGGSVFARNRPGGGAVVGFELPTLTVS